MSCSYSQDEIQNDEGFAVLGYIQEHNGMLNLSDIAGHFGFSESHCSRLIQNTTGMSFSDWKKLLRVRRAENMLQNTSMTVDEISLALGYENTNHSHMDIRSNLNVKDSQSPLGLQSGNPESIIASDG